MTVYEVMGNPEDAIKVGNNALAMFSEAMLKTYAFNKDDVMRHVDRLRRRLRSPESPL